MKFVFAIIALLALGACSSNTQNTSQSTVTTAPVAMRTKAPNNGELIFQTGKDAEGKQIVAAPPAMYPNCAACHNANGSGGKKLPGGATSADLRHTALMSSTPHYTQALLERAISTGIDNQGKKLDPVMPRWKLSKTDLHDVAAYVLTLK